MVLFVTGAAAVAGPPSFQGLGDLPGEPFSSSATDVSVDGTTVVGHGNYRLLQNGVESEAFRWTAEEGMIALGDLPGGAFLSFAWAVSADGETVVGGSSSANHARVAYRWSPGEGMIELEGVGPESTARGVSADGSVIVGTWQTAQGFTEGFRWSDGVTVGLGDLPGGAVRSEANGVSADGNVVVGITKTSFVGTEAFRWTVSDGMIALPGLTDPSHSLALSASADGSVIVGRSHLSPVARAVRWTESQGIVDLGPFPDAEAHMTALDVSSDGSVIVGDGEPLTPFSGRGGAFIWDATIGMRRVQDLLTDAGVEEVEGWLLLYATAVSADGRTIVGAGRNPSGQDEAWIAHLGAPCPADWNNDGSLDSDDYFLFLTDFFGPAGADFNGDGATNSDDYFAFLAAFFEACP